MSRVHKPPTDTSQRTTGEQPRNSLRRSAPTSRFYEDYRLGQRPKPGGNLSGKSTPATLDGDRPTSRLLNTGHLAHRAEVVIHESPGAAHGQAIPRFAPLGPDHEALAATKQRVSDRQDDQLEMIADGPLMEGRAQPLTQPLASQAGTVASGNVVPAAAVERIAEQLLKRFSMGATKGGAAARMEFAEGAFAGAAVLIEQDGDSLRVMVSSNDQETSESVARALRARFARKGQDVEVAVD